MSSREPLWLPRGSVRAIIALILVVAFTIAFLTKAVTIDPKDYGALVVIVVTTYFVTRAPNQTGGGA